MRKNITIEERCRIADEISKTIVIRDYVRGNSRDIRRKTTKIEKNIIYNIAIAALDSINFIASGEKSMYDTKTHAILNTAEFMFMRFIEDVLPINSEAHANSYDSIYNPIAKVVREWEEE